MEYRALKSFAGWNKSKGYLDIIKENEFSPEDIKELLRAEIIEPIVSEEKPKKEKAIKANKIETPEGK